MLFQTIFDCAKPLPQELYQKMVKNLSKCSKTHSFRPYLFFVCVVHSTFEFLIGKWPFSNHVNQFSYFFTIILEFKNFLHECCHLWLKIMKKRSWNKEYWVTYLQMGLQWVMLNFLHLPSITGGGFSTCIRNNLCLALFSYSSYSCVQSCPDL